VVGVDPATGDRARISGGALCVGTFAGLDCIPLGGRGAGPSLERPRAIAFESGPSFVVADEGRVVRVNRGTGRRTVVARSQSTVSADAPAVWRVRLREQLGRLSAEDPRRVHRPSDPRAWLRDALGDAPAVRQRLYAAVWKTMRDVLGPDHPDTVNAALAMPGGTGAARR
jgi:hypothetical protein